jgi:small subunit ribosomal protein S6
LKKQTKQKNLNKYEALVILNTDGGEDAEKTIVDRVQKEIQQAGGKVETVQKMGSKPFARTTGKRTAGSYVNFIFGAPAKAIRELDAKFHLDTDLFRWQITEAMPELPPRKPRDEEARAKAERGASS